MLITWNAGAIAAISSALIQSSALACSPIHDESSNQDQTARFRYEFVASVIDEESAADPNLPGKTIVVALRFRVLQSIGKEPVAGAIVTMGYQYIGTLASDCSRQTRSLTLRDWSAGSRVRIQSNDLYSAESIHTVD